MFKQAQIEIERAGRHAFNLLSGRYVVEDRRVSRLIWYYYDYTVYYIQGSLKLLFRRYRNDPYKPEQGPLKNSKVCTYQGNTPTYPGQVNGYRVKTKNRFVRIMAKYKDLLMSKHEDFYRSFINELINYREVLGGGVNTNFPLLKIMATDNGLTTSVTDILKTLSESGDGFAKFKSPKITNISYTDLETLVKLNVDASPGLMTKLLHGKTRKSSIRYSLQSANNLLNLIKTFPIKNWSLWEMLAREKDNKVVKGKEIPTRLVLSMEEPHMLINSAFGQKLTKGYACSSNESLFIGKKLDIDAANRLEKIRSKRSVCFKADWSNFDLYVTRDVLLAAFSLLRNCLPKGRESDRFLFYSWKSMQDKFVCVNPGFVYRIEKGLPSGHPLTSIIGTLINVIYWHLIFSKVYGKGYGRRFDIVASGDDSVIFCDYHENLDNLDRYIEELGLKSDSIVGTLVFTQYINDYRRKPSFLQKHFDTGLISFNVTRFIRRLVFPTKRRDVVVEDISLMQDYVDTVPTDYSLFEFVKTIFNLYSLEFKNEFSFNQDEFIRRHETREAAYLGFDTTGLSLKPVHERVKDVITGRDELRLGRFEENKEALNYLLLFPLDFIGLYYGLLSGRLKWVPP